MSSPVTWSIPAAFLALGAYFFATAPAPLPDTPDGKPTDPAAQIPVQEMFALVGAENDVWRLLYTKEIVGAGQTVGLKFSERWKERSVFAGPLPALFLRESAAYLQRTPVPLGLYLGSDFPIESSNQFEGKAASYFAEVKQTRQPQYFYAEDVKRYTAMFPDFAVAAPCVSCHNEHPASPKIDWKLGDVMGATTWTYPKAMISVEEVLSVLSATRAAFAYAYGLYLREVATFTTPPIVGEQWPRDGYFLPSVEAFMEKGASSASAMTVRRLFALPGQHGAAPASATRD